ncbi:Ig-like domain-containing protein, partial [Paracoccaceae bacterium]|nr:Ig-like domain-containing protein [Paracoccaceae bacterium]
LTGDGTISENASSLVIGTVSTVDTDQKSGVAFKYKLAGKDADLFSLNERSGELSLVRKPDYETKASYEVTIITEDSGGKKYAETFKISVVKAKAGEIYESSNAGNTTFLIADGATSGKFDVIPVKIKSDRSGYEFDVSKKTEAAYDVAADKLSETIGRDPTMEAVASDSDASTAATAAKTALTPSVTITAFNDASSTRDEYSVADGATSKDGTLYLKFTLSDSSADFVVGDITVAGGTLSNFTGSRTEYTAEFTPSGSSKVDTTINVAKDKFTNDYFGNTAATEFNWTYDPSSSGWKAGEVYENSNNTTFLIIDGVTSGKFGAIPVKVKSGGSGYEFDASKKTESSFDVAADELSISIERMTKKADASNSDASTAVIAAKTVLSPSMTIEAFISDLRPENAVADGATSNDSELILKITVSDRSSGFTKDDITVTGGTLGNDFLAHPSLANTWTVSFTPTGSSKVDTTINVAKDKFTDQLLGLGNKAATEFNWTFDPDNGLKDGDVVKEIASGSPTDKLFMLDIESTNTPIKYSLIPVKKDGDDWVYEGDNSGSTVTGGYGLSDLKLTREIGSTPIGTGDSISDSDALTILNSAGINVAIYGDEKGGSKAFTAGAYDASDDLTKNFSDGFGWILKGVKSFGETTTAKGESRGVDFDLFQLTNSLTSPELVDSQDYKITVADEAWDGSDTGNIARVRVIDSDGTSVSLSQGGSSSTEGVAAGQAEFTADASKDYFLEIMGVNTEDAQYSMIFDIV